MSNIKSNEKLKKTLISIFVIGLVITLMSLAFNIFQKTKSNVSKIKDENALYVGTYKRYENYFNKLYITIYDDGKEVERITFSTDDITNSNYTEFDNKEMKDLCFYNLTDTMKKYADEELGIFYWIKSNPSKNKIMVSSECLNPLITSQEVFINDCGVWFVNLAEKSGEVPKTSHSFVYIDKKIGV